MSGIQNHRTSDLITSLSLINRAQNRDPVAWEQLVFLYTPLIEYWASRRKVDDVESVRQDVFAALIKALVKFERRQLGSFRGWIRTITNNLINHLQGKKEPLSISSESVEWLQHQSIHEPFESDDEAEDNIIFARIHDWVVENFKPNQAEIFKRLVMDQVSAEQVATEFGITANVVYQTKSRILAAVRKEFRDLM